MSYKAPVGHGYWRCGPGFAKIRCMSTLEFALVVLLCAVALGWLAQRFNFPYPIALVIGGGALGFLPAMPEVPLEPDVLLSVVLPPILYQAATLTSWRDFKANAGTIGHVNVACASAVIAAHSTTITRTDMAAQVRDAARFGSVV